MIDLVEQYCPNCGKRWEFPSRYLGRAVRCDCGEKFVAEGNGEKPAPPKMDGGGKRQDVLKHARKALAPSPPKPKLIACPDCGHRVSKRAAACPGCGAPVKEQPGFLQVHGQQDGLAARAANLGCFIILILLAAIIGLGVLGTVFGPKPVDDLYYTVIDRVELYPYNGKYSGSILIPSYSPSTPDAELKDAAVRISRAEGLDEVVLYCTIDAYNANYSATFRRDHPNALREGYLGSWENGVFESGKRLYP